MAKLSELVNAKEKLSKIKVELAHKTTLSILDQISDAIEAVKDVPKTIDMPIRQNVTEQAKMLEGLYSGLMDKIDRSIDTFRGSCKEQSDSWAKSHNRYNPEEWLGFLAKFYGHDMADLHDQIYTLTNNNSAWQHPIMLWQMDGYHDLETSYGYYPIYVVDRWIDTGIRIRERVTPQQERKIRIYDLDRLDKVPVGCMAMIISRNHFTHASDLAFTKELEVLAKALRPGGMLAFNYNDCEFSGCAQMFENGLRSFQEGTRIKQLLEDLGLKVKVNRYIDTAKTAWLVAVKPGRLESIKRSEALGIITPK